MLGLILFESYVNVKIFLLFQITDLMHSLFILQQYVCYTKILDMFRAARCSSSGGLQSALNLHTVRLFTECDDTRGCGDTICPSEDEQCAAQTCRGS